MMLPKQPQEKKHALHFSEIDEGIEVILNLLVYYFKICIEIM